jgi:uncharacterized protein
MAAPTRFTIRVKPGSRNDAIGGTWGEDGALNVSVRQKAIDGKANAATLALLARVLGVHKRQLRVVGGVTHRTKVIEIEDPPDDLDRRLAHLRRQG